MKSIRRLESECEKEIKKNRIVVTKAGMCFGLKKMKSLLVRLESGAG